MVERWTQGRGGEERKEAKCRLHGAARTWRFLCMATLDTDILLAGWIALSLVAAPRTGQKTELHVSLSMFLWGWQIEM
jgi:hypothetical protein